MAHVAKQKNFVALAEVIYPTVYRQHGSYPGRPSCPQGPSVMSVSPTNRQ